MDENGAKKRVTIELPVELWSRWRITALEQRKSLASLTVQALENEIADLERLKAGAAATSNGKGG